jgi:hypothetical protein
MRQIDKKENNKQPPTDPLLLKYFLQAEDFNTVYEELSNGLLSFNQPYENENVSLYKLLLANIPIEIEPDGYDTDTTQANKIIYTLKFKADIKKASLTTPNTNLVTGFKYVCKKSFTNSSITYPTFEPFDGKTVYYIIKIYNKDDNSQILNQTNEKSTATTGMSTALLSSYYKNFENFGKYMPNWFDNMSYKTISRLTNFGVIFNSFLNPTQMQEINDKQFIQVKNSVNNAIKFNEHPLTYKYLSQLNLPILQHDTTNKVIFFEVATFYVRNEVQSINNNYPIGTFLEGKVGVHSHKTANFNITAISTNPSGFESLDGDGEGKEYTSNNGGPTGKTVQVSGTVNGDTVETNRIKNVGETSYTDTTNTYIENTPNSIPFYIYMYVD